MPEGDGSLSALAQRMLSLGPPSISILVARLGEIEEYQDFINLVKEFLPEREAEILRNTTPSTQIATFASYFEDRYFPLEGTFSEPESGMIESYCEITRGIPIILRSISYDDYHEISSDSRDGVQLATFLIEDPYEGEERTALAEACMQIVPVELIRLVPEGGISLDEARRLLKDTQYEGLARWADILNQDTGNCFYDNDYESLAYGNCPDWDRENVEALTTQWQQADIIDEEVGKFFDWLEGDLELRFRELLNFIIEKRGNA
ncbi:hypothetical protein ES703_84683 [subsurface metagenome]